MPVPPGSLSSPAPFTSPAARSTTDAAWWPGPPPRVESALIKGLRADPSPARVRDVLAAVDRGGGIVVEPAGSQTAVTFVWPRSAQTDACAVLLDTITDTHRGDLGPMLLEPIPGTDLLAMALLLPSDLRVTCSWWAGRALDLRAGRDREGWRRVLAECRAHPSSHDVVLNAHGGAGAVLALPDALPQPWYEYRPGVPRGRAHHLTVESRHLGRAVSVRLHRPAEASGPFALAVLLDGDVWTDVQPFDATLDNLHAERAVRPTVTAFVDPGGRERRFAELGLCDAFPAFLGEELLPRIGRIADLDRDPHARVVAGQSLGGLAAAQIVHARPDAFAAAVVQSGSFWWPDEEVPGALTGRYLHSPPVGVRVFHEVGRFENQLLEVNREFRDAARAAGVEVAYREFSGGHDHASWRGGLADGLAFLLPGPACGGGGDTTGMGGGPQRR